jgi:hypothetical protein
MRYHDVVQGSEEWHQLRKGVPTASAFSRILTPVKRQYSGAASTYIDELIADKLSVMYPRRAESYTSRSMDFGQQTEEEARRHLAFNLGLDIMNGGFCTTDDERFGASPDFLVRGKKIGGELKCPEEKTHVRWLRASKLPADHICQVHGGLVVCDYDEWIFMSYAQGWPPFILHITPDDFTQALRAAMEKFWLEFQAALQTVSQL